VRVLVLAPHPDDDVIGMGGTLRQFVLAGEETHIVYLTSGEVGLLEGTDAIVREREATTAASVLDLTSVRFWREPDGKLAVTEPLKQRLYDLLNHLQADRLYSPHQFDDHRDHGATYSLAAEVAPMFENIAWYGYEVWTPISRPDLLIDITADAGWKRAAVRSHKTQAVNSFDEASLALNHWRGLIQGPNKMFIEAFERLT
jgi:LmbE family N-acetylglucosaminyl deacetylase